MANCFCRESVQLIGLVDSPYLPGLGDVEVWEPQGVILTPERLWATWYVNFAGTVCRVAWGCPMHKCQPRV